MIMLGVITSKTALSTNLSLGNVPVFIDPDLGHPPAYDGLDLLTNMTQQNSDLLALQYRQEIEDTLSDKKKKIPGSYIVPSGSLGVEVYRLKPYVGSAINDFELSTANMTTLIAANQWITGFVSANIETGLSDQILPPHAGVRIGKSPLYFDQGFITVGNLKQKDWYASIGQMYVPFGQYNGYMINSPLTASLFTIEERPLVLGYSHTAHKTEFDAEVYAYRGATVKSPQANSMNEWGIGLDYLVNETRWNGDLGIGFVTNIADADGLQVNGQENTSRNVLRHRSCGQFAGFAAPCPDGNVLVNRVPGFDLHGSLVVEAYSMIFEYITATHAFSPLNMTYNGKGAMPQAFDWEVGYSFNMFKKPSSFSLGYSFTKQALALLLPAQEYTATFTTSFWRNTMESIGFQHDINYGCFATATGQKLSVFALGERANLGKISNTLLLSIIVSF